MSRPKPKILLESINKTTYKSEQVLGADAIYSVFYDSKPINLIENIKSYKQKPYKNI